MVRTYVSRSIPIYGIADYRGETDVWLKIDTKGLTKSDRPNFQVGDLRVTDSHGSQVYDKKWGGVRFPTGENLRLDTPLLSQNPQPAKNDFIWLTGNLRLTNRAKVDEDAYLQGLVSLENSAPMAFKIKLFNAVEGRPPRDLRLLSTHQDGSEVQCVVQYLGKKKLITDFAVAKHPFDPYGPDPNLQSQNPPEEVLLYQGSEHLEYDPVHVPETSITSASVVPLGQGKYQFTSHFIWPSSPIRNRTLYFGVDIGLKGQGFLPVRIPLKLPPLPVQGPPSIVTLPNPHATPGLNPHPQIPTASPR